MPICLSSSILNICYAKDILHLVCFSAFTSYAYFNILLPCPFFKTCMCASKCKYGHICEDALTGWKGHWRPLSWSYRQSWATQHGYRHPTQLICKSSKRSQALEISPASTSQPPSATISQLQWFWFSTIACFFDYLILEFMIPNFIFCFFF